MSQNFYNIFRNKLSVAEESNVPMHIWENIQQEIPVYQKGGTRKYLWFFLGGLLLVGGLFWGFQFTAGSWQQAAGSEQLAVLSQQSADSEQQAVLSLQSADSEQQAAGSSSWSRAGGQQAAGSGQQADLGSQSSVSSEEIEQSGVQQGAGSNEQHASGSEQQAVLSQQSTVSSSQSSVLSSQSSVSSEKIEQSGVQQGAGSNEQQAAGSGQQTVLSSQSTVSSSRLIAGSGQDAPIIAQLIDPGTQEIFEFNSVLDDEKRLGLDENIKLNETIKLQEKREHITLLNPLQEAYTSNLFIPKPDKDPICYSFGQARGARFSLDVYGGPGYALRPFSSKNEDVSSYISAREQTESYQYAFQAGARLTMHLRHGLNVGLGLHYSQVGEKFDYTDPNDTRTVTTIIEIKDNAGNVIDTRTEEVILFGITIKEIYNRYHTIDIPILVGYDIALGKVGFGIKAGPVLNISSWQRGQFLDPTLDPKFIDLENPLEYFPAYKTTLGVGAYLGVNVEVPVSPSSSIIVEPHALHRFQTLTIDSYPINQSSTQLGLNFGLRFKL